MERWDTSPTIETYTRREWGYLALLVSPFWVAVGLLLSPAIVNPATPETIIQVDTLHSPPPGFSEAFRLSCEWIPDPQKDPDA